MERNTRFLLSAFYLTHFAVVGLVVPYFNLYAHSLGFSATRIGLLFAMVPLAKALLPGLWGLAADRLGARRFLLAASTWLAALTFSGFLVADSYPACLAIMILYAALAVPALPFVEATTLEHVSTTGDDYGRIRVTGSIGFAVAAVLFGWLAPVERPFLVVPAALAVLLITAVVSSLVPVPSGARPALGIRVSSLLRRPAVFLLLAGGFLMQASHGAYIGFFSLVLAENGYSPQVMGLSWAWAIAAEVMVMLLAGRLVNGLGPRSLLALSVAMAVLRWGLYAVTMAPAAVFFGQALHGFTYAGFHVAAVQMIYRLFPPGTRATGQALYSGWTFGAGMMVGTALSGLLMDRLGSSGMFWAACGFAAGSLAVIGLGAGRESGFRNSSIPATRC
jgi:PPP family 3-phenylpropionic acid transporter